MNVDSVRMQAHELQCLSSGLDYLCDFGLVTPAWLSLLICKMGHIVALGPWGCCVGQIMNAQDLFTQSKC